MNTWLIDAVGVGAAICSMVSFVPQIVKLLREHDASGVSLRMYLVAVFGFALWTTYGALLDQWPLIASNVVNLSLAISILVLKLYYSGRQSRESADGGKRP